MRPWDIYVAEIAGDDAVFDATPFGPTPRPEVSWVLGVTRPDGGQRGILIDDFAKRGFRWLLITEDRFEGQQWPVAIYLGNDPIPRVPLACPEDAPTA